LLLEKYGFNEPRRNEEHEGRKEEERGKEDDR
jgi:hypothetical protein